MNYRLFGKSGLRVSEYCLGTMTFGEEWGWGANKQESQKVFDAFVEAGGNFIDTANYYTGGTSEIYVGEFIRAERDHFVLATKYSLCMKKGDPNAGGNHRKNMFQAVNQSLKRLQTEYLDILWLHAWDFTTPIEEVMRGLDDLIRLGKVLHIGVSDTPAWIVSKANTLSELRGWSQFVGLQVEYSLIERTVERDLLPMASHFGMMTTAWSPLGSGVLSGKYSGGKKPSQVRLAEGSGRLADKYLKIADEVNHVAQSIGATSAQVALAWLRSKGKAIIPILGARNEQQLRENLKSLEVDIPSDKMKNLEAISAIELGFPHDFLGRPWVLEHIFGGTYDKIQK